MKKSKKNNNHHNPEPYEDIIKLENLDPYEALIQSSLPLKKYEKDRQK
tara:strand:+ start:194 stop:337 length:144 start_codon:yes stop_codon:yes gene_type:complete